LTKLRSSKLLFVVSIKIQINTEFFFPNIGVKFWSEGHFWWSYLDTLFWNVTLWTKEKKALPRIWIRKYKENNKNENNNTYLAILLSSSFGSVCIPLRFYFQLMRMLMLMTMINIACCKYTYRWIISHWYIFEGKSRKHTVWHTHIA
jgi:hypothetical protein